MQRYLICIITSSLLFALNGCAKRDSSKRESDQEKNGKNDSLSLPTGNNLEIVIAQMFDEESDDIIQSRSVGAEINIKKYVYTWGSDPLYFDKRSSKLITNHPTFLVSSGDKNTPIKSFEVWGAFKLKHNQNGCDATGLEFVPLLLHKDKPDTLFLSLNNSTAGNGLLKAPLVNPTPWCGFVEVKDKQGGKLQKSFEFSVTLLESRLNLKLGRIAWDNKERLFSKDNKTERDQSKRRLYPEDLNNLFPLLSDQPRLNSIDLLGTPKAIAALQIENRHYAPFEVELPNSNMYHFSYSLRVLESYLNEVKLKDSNQLTESPYFASQGEVKDITIPFRTNDIIFTRADTGEKLKSARSSDGSIYFTLPARIIGEDALKVNVEFLTKFKILDSAFDSQRLDTSKLDKKKNYLGHLQISTEMDLFFKYKPIEGEGDWINHNEKLNGILDVVGFLRRKL